MTDKEGSEVNKGGAKHFLFVYHSFTTFIKTL